MRAKAPLGMGLPGRSRRSKTAYEGPFKGLSPLAPLRHACADSAAAVPSNSLRAGMNTPLARGSQPTAGALVKLLEVKQRRSEI